MKKLFSLLLLSIGLTGCQSTLNYKYQPTKLDNVTIVRYQEMADTYKHIKFDRFSSILTVIYELPASNLVWQQDLIEEKSEKALCADTENTIYRLAREDNIGVKFVYKGEGGKTIGPWGYDICTRIL